MENEKLFEVIYDFVGAMIFSQKGTLDKVRGTDMVDVLKGVLDRHGLWDEYREYVYKRTNEK